MVDVFDSLLHERPYKEPWPHTEVMRYIGERGGKQFDLLGNDDEPAACASSYGLCE